MIIRRRNWLKTALAGGALHLGVRPASAIDYDKPVPGADRLTAYRNGAQVVVRWNNRELCGYRAHAGQKYPYFYPLAGPVTGLSLTTESALPYPHHRGLWLGCEPLNGGDYWSDGALEKGQVRSMALELGRATPQSVTLTERCEWVRAGAPSPLQDQRRFTITVSGERLWLLDADITLTAREDVSIGRAKHSFFAIRAAADISPVYGGVLENSEGGRGAEGTYGKPARWCGYYGRRRARPGIVEGIAVMDHPENPWSPCPWFTRDYGHLSPSPFQFRERPWTLPRGQSVRLRYRVALHAGDPREALLDQLYRRWTGA
jgi:hypothetical protein